jgi:hypothetical protein
VAGGRVRLLDAITRHVTVELDGGAGVCLGQTILFTLEPAQPHVVVAGGW